MIDIGTKIKQIRLRHRISQFNLEINADLAPGTICRIERGKVYPKLETIFRIIKALNLNEHEMKEIFCINELVNYGNKD